MIFHSRVVWNLETLEIVGRFGRFDYDGPVGKLCGATKGQKDAAAQEMSTAKSMSSAFDTIFKGNENILKSITGALTPVVQAGPSQYGFSSAEDAALRTRAMDSNAAASQQVTNAVRSAEASRGGGNTYIPTGS